MTGESSEDLRQAMPSGKREECVNGIDLPCLYIKGGQSQITCSKTGILMISSCLMQDSNIFVNS